MKKIMVVVMGGTGLVGQQFVRLLDGHPYFELAAITASGRSAGRSYGQAMPWAVGGDIPERAARLEVLDTSLETVMSRAPDIVFSALPAAAAEGIEPALRERGVRVFSNAGCRRQDADVPVLIPEINPGHLELARRQQARYGGFIVTNSNCSTSGLALVLKPLEKFGLREVTVTTFQSISGAGRRGLASFDIAGNVIPWIKNEEEKMERESRKILGELTADGIRPASFPVSATCCRVPVREGHLMSVSVRFANGAGAADVAEALAAFRGVPQGLGLPTAPEQPIIVRPEEDRPQPALDAWAGRPERARGMAVSVGRIREKDGVLSLILLVHNTVRGAAGACVLGAELAAAEKLAG
ncbi:MAG: aspartate-semialdehyde dehydrogenase [Candidatus Aminicenantes bacterium RBG_16_63_16]|nr:MAG: aspartate-semialdehyde dehydrogenase [Candidatus Aminicenantes bacterium RBG_16_63_16]